MPAASWSALQEYEAQFDAALAEVLAPFADAPFEFDLFPQLSTDELTAPRLEYQFTLGKPTGPHGLAQERAAAGRAPRATAFEFQFRFLFVTDRRKLAESARAYAGTLRELLAPPAPGATAAINDELTYLEVAGLQEVYAARGFLSGAEKDKALDVFESRWEGIFAIRPEAMPD